MIVFLFFKKYLKRENYPKDTPPFVEPSTKLFDLGFVFSLCNFLQIFTKWHANFFVLSNLLMSQKSRPHRVFPLWLQVWNTTPSTYLSYSFHFFWCSSIIGSILVYFGPRHCIHEESANLISNQNSLKNARTRSVWRGQRFIRGKVFYRRPTGKEHPFELHSADFNSHPQSTFKSRFRFGLFKQSFFVFASPH